MDRLDELRREVEETQVLVFAGGLGKRMGLIDKPKPLLEVNGTPLIDICLNYFKSCGFRNFILLVGYKHELIENHVGDGSKYGIKVKYSVDPPLPKVGRGKALKHAIETGVVDRKKRAIVAYPDDIFLDPMLPLKLLLHHLEGVRLRRIKATAVFTSAIDYPYGVGKVDENNIVLSFEEKPVIKILTSTGLYAIEPEVYDLVEETVDMKSDKAVDLENLILPILAKRKQLYALIIPKDVWIPINTIKDLERATKVCSNTAKTIL